MPTCGRAWVQLTGRELLQVQAPYVGRMELQPLLERGEVAQLPEAAQAERDPREQRVLDLLETQPDLSDTAIARAAYGYANSRVVEAVQKKREGMTSVTTMTNDSDNGKPGV